MSAKKPPTRVEARIFVSYAHAASTYHKDALEKA